MAEEKILKDEVLDDEKLEQVSGGGWRQMSGDKDFLRMLTGTYYAGCDSEKENKSVIEGWAQFGIRVDTHINDTFYNLKSFNYYIGDKEISREEAFMYAMKQRGWNQVAIDCFDWDDVKGAW